MLGVLVSYPYICHRIFFSLPPRVLAVFVTHNLGPTFDKLDPHTTNILELEKVIGAKVLFFELC